MDVKLLRQFVAVYEEKNMTRAASRCHISQPALSDGIRNLENNIGRIPSPEPKKILDILSLKNS